MFREDHIEGIDTLRKKLPDELQYWHKFGNISELHYKRIFDEEYCDDIPCIVLVLTEHQYRYRIRLSLFNVSGELTFDMVNGFYSGFTIDDRSSSGYERHCRFCITSFEQDIEFMIFCERITAELV